MGRHEAIRARFDGTGWHAKRQLNDIVRYEASPVDMARKHLITRRSRVQILPPPPSKVPGQRPFSDNRGGPLSCPDDQISTVCSTLRRVTGNAGLAQGGTGRDLDPSWGRRRPRHVRALAGLPGRPGVDLRVSWAFRRISREPRPRRLLDVPIRSVRKGTLMRGTV